MRKEEMQGTRLITLTPGPVDWTSGGMVSIIRRQTGIMVPCDSRCLVGWPWEHHMVWAVLNKGQDNAIKEIVAAQSDRVAAILGGAMLDDSRQNALEYRLRKSNISARMFKIGGALGNTAAKTDLAYLLYMVEKPMLQAMEAISEIRNLFAHQLSMSFEGASDPMDKAFKKLHLHIGKTYYPDPFTNSDSTYEIGPTTTRRGQYIVNLQLVLIHLMGDYKRHAPHGNFLM